MASQYLSQNWTKGIRTLLLTKMLSIFGFWTAVSVDRKVVVCKGGEALTIRRVIRGDWRRPN